MMGNDDVENGEQFVTRDDDREASTRDWNEIYLFLIIITQ